jgi:hypothetical protein
MKTSIIGLILLFCLNVSGQSSLDSIWYGDHYIDPQEFIIDKGFGKTLPDQMLFTIGGLISLLDEYVKDCSIPDTIIEATKGSYYYNILIHGENGKGEILKEDRYMIIIETPSPAGFIEFLRKKFVNSK